MDMQNCSDAANRIEEKQILIECITISQVIQVEQTHASKHGYCPNTLSTNPGCVLPHDNSVALLLCAPIQFVRMIEPSYSYPSSQLVSFHLSAISCDRVIQMVSLLGVLQVCSCCLLYCVFQAHFS